MADSTRVVHVADGIPDAMYIGRANPRKGLKGSPLGNPFKVTHYGRAKALQMYAEHLAREVHDGNPAIIEALIACRGKPLACFCRRDDVAERPDNSCHGDILIGWLDECSDDELRGFVQAPDQPAAGSAERAERETESA